MIPAHNGPWTSGGLRSPPLINPFPFPMPRQSKSATRRVRSGAPRSPERCIGTNAPPRIGHTTACLGATICLPWPPRPRSGTPLAPRVPWALGFGAHDGEEGVWGGCLCPITARSPCRQERAAAVQPSAGAKVSPSSLRGVGAGSKVSLGGEKKKAGKPGRNWADQIAESPWQRHGVGGPTQ